MPVVWQYHVSMTPPTARIDAGLGTGRLLFPGNILGQAPHCPGLVRVRGHFVPGRAVDLDELRRRQATPFLPPGVQTGKAVWYTTGFWKTRATCKSDRSVKSFLPCVVFGARQLHAVPVMSRTVF